MSVLWGVTAGQGPVGEVPTGQQGVRGHDLDSPPEGFKQAGEALRSGAKAKGQGPLIKWLFPAIPHWPLDSGTDRKMPKQVHLQEVIKSWLQVKEEWLEQQIQGDKEQWVPF